MINIVSNAGNEKEIFEVGDLVIFSGVSQQTIKNQIGIIIGYSLSAQEVEMFMDDDWYIVQFGPMKLMVNDTMIEKLSKDEV